MNSGLQDIVNSDEDIVRLLHKEWIVNGVIQQSAFQLRNGETYLSVNRPAVASFDLDVSVFISQHPQYRFPSSIHSYKRASMNVGGVRNMELSFKEERINVSVEVEPRASHAKSHAGIFARIEGVAIKGGQDRLSISNQELPLSAGAILQKMRWQLL